MALEQAKVLEGLQFALRMETDGKKFYLKASERTINPPGKVLFKTLAGEEDIHAHIFTGIYEAMSRSKEWPQTNFKPDGGSHIRTVFSAAMRKAGKGAPGEEGEVADAKAALDMENRTFDYYKKMAGIAGYPAEKQFYEALASQEQEHHLILLDYYEFLKDPAAWYVKAERPSLDGV